MSKQTLCHSSSSLVRGIDMVTGNSLDGLVNSKVEPDPDELAMEEEMQAWVLFGFGVGCLQDSGAFPQVQSSQISSRHPCRNPTRQSRCPRSHCQDPALGRV